jgi:hypothetical protein
MTREWTSRRTAVLNMFFGMWERQATRQGSETLGYRAKVKRTCLQGSRAGVKVRERRAGEGQTIVSRGRPLKRKKPRRVSATVIGLTSTIVRTDLLEG